MNIMKNVRKNKYLISYILHSNLQFDVLYKINTKYNFYAVQI